MSTLTLNSRLATALSCHRRGLLSQARAYYTAILQESPRCFDALHLLGILNADSGAVERGIELIRDALAVDASRPQAHYSLASALAKSGDSRSALSSLDHAIALQPTFAEAWLLRGNILQLTDDLLGSVESYERAIAIRPAYPDAYNNLAAAQRALRHLASAYESANRAIALEPGSSKALNNRGLIQLERGHAAAAVEDFQGAIALDSNFPEAVHNLGTALMQLRLFGQARDAFAKLRYIAPDFRHVQGNLLFAKLSCCDWDGFDAAVADVEQAVNRGEHASLPAVLLSFCGSPALQLRCATLYSQAYFPTRQSLHGNPSRSRHERIRVAYLSGDFGEHAITYLLAGVFERHDSSRYETFAISWGRRGSGPTRQRAEAAFSRFIDVTQSADSEVARLLQDLEVDIAIDLMGHTLGQRTGILARRAAPIQVNFLGLPATMGAPYIDYLIADRQLVPEDQTKHYSERLVLLPESFQPNDDRRIVSVEPTSRSAHGLSDEAFVFCCFNRNHKLTPSYFHLWMRILSRTPGSVLWLLATGPEAATNLRRAAARCGVEVSRLVFVGDAPYEQYLSLYRAADLFLDTAPFNGGATVSDAVSMGVPVLTCAGESFASRMASSVLSALGLPELVTQSLSEYEETAVQLAGDRIALAALRRRLTQNRRPGGFFDTDRFRLVLEAAYSAMWQRYAADAAGNVLASAIKGPTC